MDAGFYGQTHGLTPCIETTSLQESPGKIKMVQIENLGALQAAR
jgi:hypothetical protein